MSRAYLFGNLARAFEFSGQRHDERKEPASKLEEISMDWNRIEGNWKQFSGKVREKWGDLTDDDLQKVEGHREQLEGMLQQRYGYAKDKAKAEVDSWLNTLH
jgi:uncharacterized protein YjbJ (UPF0337 family)